jgi:hypothetical protein
MHRALDPVVEDSESKEQSILVQWIERAMADSTNFPNRVCASLVLYTFATERANGLARLIERGQTQPPPRQTLREVVTRAAPRLQQLSRTPGEIDQQVTGVRRVIEHGVTRGQHDQVMLNCERSRDTARESAQRYAAGLVARELRKVLEELSRCVQVDQATAFVRERVQRLVGRIDELAELDAARRALGAELQQRISSLRVENAMDAKDLNASVTSYIDATYLKKMLESSDEATRDMNWALSVESAATAPFHLEELYGNEIDRDGALLDNLQRRVSQYCARETATRSLLLGRLGEWVVSKASESAAIWESATSDKDFVSGEQFAALTQLVAELPPRKWYSERRIFHNDFVTNVADVIRVLTRRANRVRQVAMPMDWWKQGVSSVVRLYLSDAFY